MTKQVINGYTIYMDSQLGSGNFATVHKAVNNKTKKVYAVKILSKIQIQMDEQRKVSFQQEIVAMQTKSQHIVQFIEMFQDKNCYYIIQQLCDGNLRQYLKKQQYMDEQKAIRFLTEICIGVKALVRRNITHRDLKPQNILLKQGRIKIADFGVSRKNLHNKCSFDIPAGSLVYMSLQALKGQKHTSKADIWTIGLIFYQLLHGQCPWYRQGDDQHTLIKKIQSQKVRAKSILSSLTKSFLKKCLEIEEQKRLDWPQFFSHPIFKGKFSDYIEQRKEMYKKMTDILNIFGNYIEKKQTNFMNIYTPLIQKEFLTLLEFQELLKIIDPSVNKHEIQFIFEETDVDQDGCLSVEELQQRLFQSKQKKPSMSMSKIKSERDQVKSSMSDSDILLQYKESKLDELATRQKIRSSLKKMQSILNIKGQTLAYAFKKKSEGTMKMNKDLFTIFMKKYNSQFPQSQISQIFNLMGCSLECAGYVRYQDFVMLYDRATGNQQNIPRLIKKDTAPAMFSSFHQNPISNKLSGSCNLGKKDDILYMSYHQNDQYSNSLGSFNKIKSNNSNEGKMMYSSQISIQNNSSIIKKNEKMGNGMKSNTICSQKDEWQV